MSSKWKNFSNVSQINPKDDRDVIQYVRLSGQVKWNLSDIVFATMYIFIYTIVALFPFYVAYTYGKYSESMQNGSRKRSDELRRSVILMLFILVLLVLSRIYRKC